MTENKYKRLRLL